MMKLLDLFCKAGGCSTGYRNAGFDVVGVDHEYQSNYPPSIRFVKEDAFRAIERFANSVDAIHASPPCQAYSVTRSLHGNIHPDLVSPIRDALNATGKPYVIENVPGAPLLNPATLCGTMFDLSVGIWHLRRHRLFETNWPFVVKMADACSGKLTAGVYGHGGSYDLCRWQHFPAPMAREVMRTPWMTYREMAQASPPRTRNMSADN